MYKDDAIHNMIKTNAPKHYNGSQYIQLRLMEEVREVKWLIPPHGNIFPSIT